MIGPFFDNFRLTYLGEATAEEAFTELMGSFQNLINDFNDLGAEAIKSELQVVYMTSMLEPQAMSRRRCKLYQRL